MSAATSLAIIWLALRLLCSVEVFSSPDWESTYMLVSAV